MDGRIARGAHALALRPRSEVPSGLGNAPPPYQFPSAYLQGNPDFIAETLIAYEVGYRAALGPQLAISLSTFYNDYNDLRSTSLTPTTASYPFPTRSYFQNNLEGDTYGMELSASYQVLDWWRLHAGYDLLRENIHVKPGAVDAHRRDQRDGRSAAAGRAALEHGPARHGDARRRAALGR